jgi:hypothetical protein
MPRRLKRLHVTTGILQPPLALAWAPIEEAYDREIPLDQRNLLEDATRRAVWLAESERRAPPWADAGYKISDLTKTARKLLKLLEGPSDLIIDSAALGREEPSPEPGRGYFPSQHDEGRDLQAFVVHLIRQNLKLPSQPPLRGDHLAIFVRDLEAVCLALSEIDLSKITGHQQQGQAWDAWTCECTKILEDAGLGLPVSVSKDHRSASDSHFVRLVAALQDQLQEDFRRCQYEYQGKRFTNTPKLADAIHSARERNIQTLKHPDKAVAG